MTRTLIVLLRAINVGGRQAPMARLRAACEAAGFARVRSYVASGNLLLDTPLAATEVEAAVEAIVARDFGFHSDAIARDRDQWNAIVAAAPFPTEREARAKMVHLCLSKRPLSADAAARIAERAQAGEQVTQIGDALWIDYAEGVGRSKLTPALLDKAAGSPVTGRNWRSVVALRDLVGEAA
jgi:uncharacterized protein (DUF1697 family)